MWPACGSEEGGVRREVSKRAKLLTLVNSPMKRSNSPTVCGCDFTGLKLSCTCITFSMGRSRMGRTLSTIGLFRVHKVGIAVPSGARTTGCISRLSPTTRVVKTMGAVIGSSNELAKCVASKRNFMRGLGSRNMSVGKGGVAITNNNKTTATVRMRYTLSKTERVAVFGVGSTFFRHALRATRGVQGTIPKVIIGMCSVTSATGVARRVASDSVFTGTAVINVGPVSSRDIMGSLSTFHPKLIMYSTICGPTRAGLLQRTGRTKYAYVKNGKVLL